MRVRLTTDRTGPAGHQAEGEVIDLPRGEALRLIAARQAESDDFEAATAPPSAEEAVSRKGSKR